MSLRLLAVGVLAGLAAGQSAQTICSGSQIMQACPCAVSFETGGCPNSVSLSGGLLLPWPEWAIDSPSVAADIVTLVAERLPPNTTVMFCQATAQIAPVSFGDGARCLGGSVMRLGVRQTTPYASWPSGTMMGTAGMDSLALRGQIPPTGGFRVYQAWYRNAVQFCTAATFNMTNAIGIYWQP